MVSFYVRADLYIIPKVDNTMVKMKCDLTDRCITASMIDDSILVYDSARNRYIKGNSAIPNLVKEVTHCELIKIMKIWSKRCDDEKFIIGDLK